MLGASRTELARFITVGVDEQVRVEIGGCREAAGARRADPQFGAAAPCGSRRASPLLRVSSRTSADALVPGGYDPHQRDDVREPLSARGGGRQPVQRRGRGGRRDACQVRGLAIDHARRYTGAATRGDELARTVAALEATTEIARAVGGATDVDVILELVAKRGRAPVSAQALLIEIVDGAELVVAAAAGHRPAGLLGARIVLTDTVASAALLTRATHRLEVELNRARFDQHGLGRLGVSADAGLVVPLIFHNQTYAVLIALDRLHDGPAFAAEDHGLLEGFATSAAISAATARSVASELQRQRLAAAEGKRGRWARELHDETLQNLAGLRLSRSTAHRKGGLKALEDAAVQAIENIEEAISNLRALVTDLRPAALDELGLKPAVERASRHGLEIDSSLELAFEQGHEPTRHTPELETLIYRIIQESLTNATKHGHPRGR